MVKKTVKKNKKVTTKKKLEKVALEATTWIGSIESLLVHTLVFVASFCLVLFGISLDRVLLVLTTALSLEAIYLAIFIQMSVNRNTAQLTEVEKDLEEIQEDVDEISNDIDEIQEDVEEIGKDIEEIEKDVDEIEKEIDEIEKNVDEIEKDVDEIQEDVEEISGDVEEIEKDIEEISPARGEKK